MKTNFLLTTVLFLQLGCMAAQNIPAVTDTQQQLHDMYRKKRNNNMIAGWAMVGAGTAMVIGGIAINLDSGFDFNSNTNQNKGLWLSYVGGATVLGSIPLFVCAGKNNRKAKLALTSGNAFNGRAGKETVAGLSLTVPF